MTTAKVSDLTGLALDWAVAKCLGGTEFYFDTVATYWIKIDGEDRALSKGWAQSFTPSSDWSHGGPIIERETISILRCDDEYGIDKKGFTTNKRIPVWAAVAGEYHSLNETFGPQGDYWGSVYSVDCDVTKGKTPLIAAMRCYVASNLGNEVDIPEELLK